MHVWPTTAIACVAALSVLGCDAQLARTTPKVPTDQIDPSNNRPNPDDSPPELKPGKVAGPWVTRRLSREQYSYMIRDTFGSALTQEQMELLPREARTEGFKNNVFGLVVSLEHVTAWRQVAQQVAQEASDDFIASYSDCQTLDDEACERSFVEGMGAKLFRRPVQPREVESFGGLFDLAEAEGMSFEQGARLIIEAMLLSPQTLYLLEPDTNPDDEVVKGYEMAQRLSFFIWQSSPDDALIRAAANGELDTADGVLAQARRMLAERPLSERATARFMRDWMALDRLEGASREDLSPELARDMLQSAVLTYQDHVWDQSNPLPELFNTQTHLLSGPLAELYGIPSKGASFEPYDLSEVEERVGLFTLPGVLAAMSDRDVGGIVARGLFVMEDLLCKHPLSPPADLDLTQFENHLEPEATERDYSEDRFKTGSCAGCHIQFDPFAFSLERFDGIGRYSERSEFDRPLRSDGSALLDGKPRPFETVQEFTTLFGASQEANVCLTRKHLQFALGFAMEKEHDPGVHQVYLDFTANGSTYESMVLAIVQNDLFRVRHASSEDRP